MYMEDHFKRGRHRMKSVYGEEGTRAKNEVQGPGILTERKII